MRIAELFRKKRIYLAVGVDGMLSISTLLLTVAIARQSNIAQFGIAAFALTVYLLAIGMVRATVTDTILSLPGRIETRSVGYQRVLLVGVFAGALCVIAGALTHAVYLMILGGALPGLLALDYIRVTSSALYRAEVAVWAAALWSLTSMSVSTSALFLQISAPWVFAGWAVSGALVGLIVGKCQGLPSSPKWDRTHIQNRGATWFALDYVAGSGGSQLTSSLLAIVVSPSILAALRGAGTLLGPANLISTSARSLLLPFLTRARAVSQGNERTSAMIATAMVTSVAGALAVVVVLLGPLIGRELLGETWSIAEPVLAPLAIESVLALAGSIPAAGHRSRFAGRRTAILRLSVGTLRPLTVVPAGFFLGAPGAAWAMVFISALNLLVWWVSYIHLLKHSQIPPAIQR